MKLTLILGTICAIVATTIAEDNKWVWKDNTRNGEARSGGLRYEKSDKARYSVHENFDAIPQNRPIEERPLYPDPGYLNRPQVGVFPNDRPIIQRPPPLQNHRPGGLYGNNAIVGGYGRPNPSDYYPSEQGVLTGPIPSWVKEGPFKNYDTCKCTEKFNCRSPGISYGHCDVGKKYCCYNRNKIEDLGSDYPQRPIHSAENGILVGPGGPIGTIGRPGVINNPENGVLVGPGKPGNGFGRPGGFLRPGDFNRPGSFVGRPNGYGSHHGVLVGPNRSPYDERRDY